MSPCIFAPYISGKYMVHSELQNVPLIFGVPIRDFSFHVSTRYAFRLSARAAIRLSSLTRCQNLENIAIINQ